MDVTGRRVGRWIVLGSLVVAFLFTAGAVAAGPGGQSAAVPADGVPGVHGAVGDGIVSTQDSPSGSVETEYFEIKYYEGSADEAESIAGFADEYYELLFQRFGVEPGEGRTEVFVGSMSELPCETEDVDGCYRVPPGAIYVSDDRPGLFYHELIHHYQWRAGANTGGTRPLEIGIEGTAQYLQEPDDEIARDAQFRFDKDWYFTVRNADGEHYNEFALFSEYLLAEYGRAGFDVLFTESWIWPGGGNFGDSLEAATGTDYAEIRDGFMDQLPQQERRMEDAETPLPGFTYEPFFVTPGTEVTFDARSPEVIEDLDRSWYPSEPDAYEWDLTGDGEIDATGPEVTTTDPGESVTLFVTIDDETYEATQEILRREPAIDLRSTAVGEESVERGEPLEISATLENEGDAAGEETVAVSVDGEEVANESVTVAPGGSETVSVEHTFGAVGTHTIAVNGREIDRVEVLEPADISVTDLSLSENTVAVSETPHVSFTLENTGDVSTETTVEARARAVSANESTQLASTVHSLEGGERLEETLTAAVNTPGRYEVTVNGEPAGELGVFDPEQIEVIDATLSETELAADRTLFVEATVENPGEVAAEGVVDLGVDEEVVDERTVEVPAGDMTVIEFEHEFETADEDREVRIDVGEYDAGTVTLAGSETDGDGDSGGNEETDTDGDAGDDGADGNSASADDGGAGFGVLVAVLAVVLSAVASSQVRR